MVGHDIIVIGASAGGVETLSQLVSLLPADLPASIFIVVHLPQQGTSVLPQILRRKGKLPAFHAEDGQSIEPARIYVAPPGYHMWLGKSRIRLTGAPLESGHRPAINPLFRSAADNYGGRVVGIVLSGMLDDGTAGLVAISQCSGVTIVQDPREALFAGMPQHAIDHHDISMVLPIRGIAAQIVRLASIPAGVLLPALQDDGSIPAQDAGPHPEMPLDTYSECHRALREFHDEMRQFSCETGHVYAVSGLLEAQTDGLEAALWTALRALERSAALNRRLHARAFRCGRHIGAEQFATQAEEMERQAVAVRKVLLRGGSDRPAIAG